MESSTFDAHPVAPDNDPPDAIQMDERVSETDTHILMENGIGKNENTDDSDQESDRFSEIDVTENNGGTCDMLPEHSFSPQVKIRNAVVFKMTRMPNTSPSRRFMVAEHLIIPRNVSITVNDVNWIVVMILVV